MKYNKFRKKCKYDKQKEIYYIEEPLYKYTHKGIIPTKKETTYNFESEIEDLKINTIEIQDIIILEDININGATSFIENEEDVYLNIPCIVLSKKTGRRFRTEIPTYYGQWESSLDRIPGKLRNNSFEKSSTEEEEKQWELEIENKFYELEDKEENFIVWAGIQIY